MKEREKEKHHHSSCTLIGQVTFSVRIVRKRHHSEHMADKGGLVSSDISAPPNGCWRNVKETPNERNLERFE